MVLDATAIVIGNIAVIFSVCVLLVKASMDFSALKQEVHDLPCKSKNVCRRR